MLKYREVKQLYQERHTYLHHGLHHLQHFAKLRQRSKAKIAVQEGNRVLFRRILHMLHNNIYYEARKRNHLHQEQVFIAHLLTYLRTYLLAY